MTKIICCFCHFGVNNTHFVCYWKIQVIINREKIDEKEKLLEVVRDKICVKHYSLSAE